MRILEEGQGRVRLDVGDAFTAEAAQRFLQFMQTCPYRNHIRLLVLPGLSKSHLDEADAIAFGRAISACLSGGSGRIAVVYDPASERQELEYTLIDTTISLNHRLIAQFRDIDEAKSWLDWDLAISERKQTG